MQHFNLYNSESMKTSVLMLSWIVCLQILSIEKHCWDAVKEVEGSGREPETSQETGLQMKYDKTTLLSPAFAFKNLSPNTEMQQPPMFEMAALL